MTDHDWSKFTDEQVINELRQIINCMTMEIWPERIRISHACKAAIHKIENKKS